MSTREDITSSAEWKVAAQTALRHYDPSKVVVIPRQAKRNELFLRRIISKTNRPHIRKILRYGGDAPRYIRRASSRVLMMAVQANSEAQAVIPATA